MIVLEVSKNKHPEGKSASRDAILPVEATAHLVLFDKIDAPWIRTTVLSTTGSAGPSGLDAKPVVGCAHPIQGSQMICVMLWA